MHEPLTLADVSHRHIETNGIRLHVAECGHGPLVILCHGFPETWYSWRHQLVALANAGFRVVAPDQRGYGQSDGPSDLRAYDILHLVGDIAGLVAALGATDAAVIGNDWGSVVAAHCALLRPDLFTAVGLMSVPYMPRHWGGHPPTEVMTRTSRNEVFYQVHFQQPDAPEAELERNVRNSILGILYSLSGNAPSESRWQPYLDDSGNLARPEYVPVTLPEWLSEDDLQNYVNDFERTGFRNALNWYRNIDRNWELTAFLSGAPIRQPSLFLAGSLDGAFLLYRNYTSAFDKSMPNLTTEDILEGIGHWSAQEDPHGVNERLIAFLRSVAR